MSRFEIPDHVLRATLEDEEVLLNTVTEAYHVLNPTGRFLIQAFESGKDFDGSVQDLAERFAQPLEAVRVDAREFVKKMEERGLIKAVDE